MKKLRYNKKAGFYTKAAKMVVEKEAALAGYRLADEIEKWVR